MMPDYDWVGIPWVGRKASRDGADCVGLIKLFYEAEFGIRLADATADDARQSPLPELEQTPWAQMPRGSVGVFARGTEPCHVGIALGEGRILHATMDGSRIDNNLSLLSRCGIRYLGALPPDDIPRLAVLLKDSRLKLGADALILIAISVISLAASFALRPKVPRIGATSGRYGFSPLTTSTSTQLPLPDLLGAAMLAGNSVFQSTLDKQQTVTDPTLQKINRVVVWCGGPVYSLAAVSQAGPTLRIAGQDFFARAFHPGFNNDGLTHVPPGSQTYAKCLAGTFGAAPDTNVPNFTCWPGTPDISVPVDIRAQYDREMPVYGFNGACYTVLRFINSSIFTDLNCQQLIFGRYCRQFNASGFVRNSVVNESLAGADGTKVRFKLAHWDIEAISAITVNAVSQSPMSASAQTGAVYQLNKTKGYVEFVTPPAAAATILVSYTYFYREIGSNDTNPADHIVYLLTEPVRGKGFDESKIDWVSFNDAKTHFAQSVTWQTSEGPATFARYLTDYVLDSRKPLREHVQALLDACHSALFLSGGKFKLKPIKTETSVFSFNTSNIITDSFSSQMADRSQRQNRVKLTYRSSEAFNAETEVSRDDVMDQRAREPRVGNGGVVEENLTMPAVTRKAQAERLAETLLREETGVRWTCRFKTSLKGLALEPGDVIDVTHPSQPAWVGKLFRIDEIPLDPEDHLQLRCTEYSDALFVA